MKSSRQAIPLNAEEITRWFSSALETSFSKHSKSDIHRLAQINGLTSPTKSLSFVSNSSRRGQFLAVSKSIFRGRLLLKRVEEISICCNEKERRILGNLISEAFLHSDPPVHVACGDDRGWGCEKNYDFDASA
jgi:hypothetical protein